MCVDINSEFCFSESYPCLYCKAKMPPGIAFKQNPLSLQNILSSPQEGSMHSSDPPSPALQKEEQTFGITQGLGNLHLVLPFTRVFFETVQFLQAFLNYIKTRKWHHTTLCLNTKNQACGIVPDIQQVISSARKVLPRY